MQRISHQTRWFLAAMAMLFIGGLALLSLSLTYHGVRALDANTGADWEMFGYDAAHTHFNALETTLSPDNVSTLTLRWSVLGSVPGWWQPALAEAGGILYVPTSSSTLSALDTSTGTSLWALTTAQNARPYFAAVSGSTVYVATTSGVVYALNAATGASIWTHTFGSGIASAPTVTDGMVFVSLANHKVQALNAATGTVLWSFATGGIVDISSPAVANGVVYVGIKNPPKSTAASVIALNAATGKKLWGYATIGQVFSAPAVSGGIVYIGSTNKNLYALNATTGTLLWSHKTWNAIYASPAVDRSTVYISEGGGLHALDAVTGEVRWHAPYGSRYMSPSVANGVVYLGLTALNAATGHVLYNSGQSGYDPIIANGMVYTIADSGQISAYGLPG